MLLRQAKSEGIVTYLSNLYDTFFDGGKDHRVDKPSVLHLPYFEGAPGPLDRPMLHSLTDQCRNQRSSSAMVG